jgi:uncharacterized protein
MAKLLHEIRDPIHVFVHLDSEERRVVNSRPFQRLRYIHQLAMTYLVYPGATHTRFEHSLGVMELASRVFDVLMTDANIHGEIVRQVLPGPDALRYWRRVLRMAALCHDLGHLPFSHAAEKELLPTGSTHETFTVNFITSPEMREIWEHMRPPLIADDIVKLAVGEKELKDTAFDDWESVLASIVTGDAFGVDRIDYLLRDSLHAGVAYGRFDHFRLIDTLRILPKPVGDTTTLTLGVEEGGLQSAEAMLLARYFMFSQLYFHPVRRIYDIHLKDFLISWLQGGKYPTDLEAYLAMTDAEVISGLRSAAGDSALPSHDPASRIVTRQHFRLLYDRNPSDLIRNSKAGSSIYSAACEEFGDVNVRYDSYAQKNVPIDFPVETRDGRIESSLALSKTLSDLPIAAVDYVFIEPKLRDKARRWLQDNREAIIAKEEEEQ